MNMKEQVLSNLAKIGAARIGEKDPSYMEAWTWAKMCAKALGYKATSASPMTWSAPSEVPGDAQYGVYAPEIDMVIISSNATTLEDRVNLLVHEFMHSIQHAEKNLLSVARSTSSVFDAHGGAVCEWHEQEALTVQAMWYNGCLDPEDPRVLAHKERLINSYIEASKEASKHNKLS
jgi:hypothetical protein